MSERPLGGIPDASDLLAPYLEVDEARKPFPRGKNQFMLWLSREEFQFVYSATLALQMAGDLNAALDMADAFEAVIERMIDEDGYEFRGLALDEDGRIVPTTIRAIEPNNGHWVAMLYQADPLAPSGKSLDLAIHLPVAIRHARENESLAGYVDALEFAWSKVQKDAETVRETAKYTEPEVRREARERIRRIRETIH